MVDHVAEIAIYWFFAVLLAGGALMQYVNSGQMSHVRFAGRQIGLTIVVSWLTFNDHLPPGFLIAVLAAMAINVLLYQPYHKAN